MNFQKLYLILCFLFLIVSQSTLAKDRLVVDFTAAEKTIEWLKYINTNPGYDNIKSHFFENVAPSKGVQSIIHHWARFKTWNNEEYFK